MIDEPNAIVVDRVPLAVLGNCQPVTYPCREPYLFFGLKTNRM
jgi:hypothetical protein